MDDVMGQKLWIVRIVHEAYVLAADEKEAMRAKSEIEKWEEEPVEFTAVPWDERHLAGWTDECGVYGTGGTVSLRQAKLMDKH